MTINLYLASFDTCHEWPGRWFEISSLEDLKEAILVCNSFGVEEIEPRVIRDYFLQSYQIDEVVSAYSSSSIDVIDRGESLFSDSELVGYYFAEIIDFQRIPGIFRDYFDYEAYGRDIIIGGTYEILESDSCLYLVS